MSVFYIWLFGVFIFLGEIAYFDFRYRRVPNLALGGAVFFQCVFLLLSALAVFQCSFFSSLKIFDVFAGWVFGFLFLPFWFVRIMGAGDVKFISVLGFIVGLSSLVWIVLVSGLLAGSHALMQVLSARKFGDQGSRKARGVPYAGYIALTAIIWLIWKLLE